MASVAKKIGWWLDSVRGLRAHLQLFRAMKRLHDEIPPEKRTPEGVAQLKAQKAMVGHCLLHVLLVYPPGSGRMMD